MSDSPIRTRREGAIFEVTLDRPKANAIDLVTSRIMGDAFKAFRDDDSLRVAIITGGGEKFFCPGWDLKAAADGDAVDDDYGVGGFGGLQELRGMNKPVIAAVNGICCGGGLELAASTHVRIAEPSTIFQLPEMPDTRRVHTSSSFLNRKKTAKSGPSPFESIGIGTILVRNTGSPGIWMPVISTRSSNGFQPSEDSSPST